MVDTSLSSPINRPLNRWLPVTVSASWAAKSGRPRVAALLWEKAYASSFCFPESDPRRAAALHNAALGQLILGDRQKARELLTAARRQWQRAESWVLKTDLPLVGRSTSFHLLLAANNSEAFLRLHREKYLKLCAAAASITEAIFYYIDSSPALHSDTRRLIGELREAFGEECSEVRSLQHLASLSARALDTRETRHRETRWRAVSQNTPIEMQALVDAAYLTAGLHPKHLPWIQQAVHPHNCPTICRNA